MVIITIYLSLKDLLCLIDGSDCLSGAGSYDSVLKPTIWPFYLSSGLRREGMNNFDLTVIENLFPLGIDIVGDFMMGAPEGISLLYESKYGMGVDVISIGETIRQNHILQGRDMVPAGLRLDEVVKKHFPAVVIQACY